MTGDLIKLTGKGYIKCIGHTGLDKDPDGYKLMQLEVLCPLFVRNELQEIFHTDFSFTGSYYYPSLWFGKDGKQLPKFGSDGADSLWRSSVKHRLDDYKVAIEDIHPAQATMFLPTLAEYVSFVTEPLSLQAIFNATSKINSRSPDAKSLLNAVSAFCKELWFDTMNRLEKEVPI